MEPNTTLPTALSALQNGWADLWRHVGDLPLPEPAWPRICARLRRFSPKHRPENSDAALRRLSQGKHLVEAALTWTCPTAGPRPPAEANDNERTRGEQWRLVMAFAGLERLAKTLLLIKPAAGLTPDDLARFVARCQPPDYGEPLPPPPPPVGPLPPDFNRGVQRYLEGHHITGWADALILAKCLRHATAHGTLAASRAVKLALRPALTRLTDDVGRAAAAVFGRLAAG
jgi:hypothetical protein